MAERMGLGLRFTGMGQAVQPAGSSLVCIAGGGMHYGKTMRAKFRAFISLPIERDLYDQSSAVIATARI